MNIEPGGRSAVASTQLPHYGHHAVIVGSTIILVTIAVIAAVILLIMWGRGGR